MRKAAKKRDSKRSWNRRNPEKQAAYKDLSNAVAAGAVLKPDTCSDCGQTTFIVGLHEQYADPYDVIWLCAFCAWCRRHPEKAKSTKSPSRRYGISPR